MHASYYLISMMKFSCEILKNINKQINATMNIEI